MGKINVTIWNENIDERIKEKYPKNLNNTIDEHLKNIKKVYPAGLHNTIAEYLKKDKDIETKTATLYQKHHGLGDNVLENTDVLIWWGHAAHEQVSDEIVEKIYKRVINGMGLITLHSAHQSKIFKKLMGTTCSLRWREAKEKEILWVINPSHPIAKDVGEYVELENTEMYGEYFDIPKPDEIVFTGWFKGGEVFRSGICYKRGYGKIFFFQPGHETYPIYHNEKILHIIKNAVKWAKPPKDLEKIISKNTKSVEEV